MQNETCHFQVLINPFSEDMTLFFSLKHCLEVKLLNILKNSKMQHFVFLCLSSEIIWNFLASVAKTVPRLQMDLEMIYIYLECEGNCSSFVQEHWVLLSTEVLSTDCTVKQCKKATLCIEAVNEKQEPDFHFKDYHSWQCHTAV